MHVNHQEFNQYTFNHHENDTQFRHKFQAMKIYAFSFTNTDIKFRDRRKLPMMHRLKISICIYHASLVQFLESQGIPNIHINHTFKCHITINSVTFIQFMNPIIESSTSIYEGSFRQIKLFKINNINRMEIV
jgi:hypothetical protein